MVLWIPPCTLTLRLRGFHPVSPVFPVPFCCTHVSLMRSEPQSARALVWALSISLAATLEIDVSFSSSGYLDVSVHRVPLHNLWIQLWIHGVFPCGFPHSEIRGSLDICSSPRLFAAYHVFLRLSVPRHPPCALSCLTISLCLPPFFTSAVRPANCTDNLRQQIFCSLYSVIEIGLRFGSFWFFLFCCYLLCFRYQFPDIGLGCLNFYL